MRYFQVKIAMRIATVPQNPPKTDWSPTYSLPCSVCVNLMSSSVRVLSDCDEPYNHQNHDLSLRDFLLNNYECNMD